MKLQSADAKIEDVCQPVYEPGVSDTHTGESGPPRLVMTPYLLLDGLKACQEDAHALLAEVQRTGVGMERRCGVLVNPLADRLEKLHFDMGVMLRLLWRGGLWTDGEVVEEADIDGVLHRVLREPFTDGKPNGRPISADAPYWQRELLGLPPQEEPNEVVLELEASFVPLTEELYKAA